MVQEYAVEGMTCESCVGKVKSILEKFDGVEQADVQLTSPQLRLSTKATIKLSTLQQALGKYHIQNLQNQAPAEKAGEVSSISLKTYKPLLLIVVFLVGTSLLAQFPFDHFSAMSWMRHFMAGFFLAFAFFKLLNLDGFVESYRMYDPITSQWIGWGYIYPFIELGLGVLYLTNVFPYFTNFATLIILSIGSIGVVESNLNKRKIKCACLGDVFNLPMSTVTIIENLSMILMASLMLYWR